ncbi:MAG: hypothetical protein P8X54_01090 [Desulfuromonadales bacterium]|jgi:hypothetical protein
MRFLKFVVLSFVVAGLLGLSATTSSAQGRDLEWSDPWRFHVNIYGWLPDAPATISVNGKEVVDVPEELDTILDSLDMTAMFELEAHKGPLVLFANNVYYKGKYDENFTGPITNLPKKYELQEEVWAIKYGAGYNLGTWNLGQSDGSPTMSLIPWVGGFYFHDDWSLTIKPYGEPLSGKVTGTYDFNTPMVGLASRVGLSEKWYINLSYGYGGWDVDSVDEVYDFVGNVAYRFKMGDVSAKVLAGYRYLHFNRPDNRGIEIDLTCKGPFLGIGWEF